MNNKILSRIALPLLLYIYWPALAESLRVNTDWMHENLHRPNQAILDVRQPDNYEIAHIEGALNFPESLTYQQKTTDGKIVEPDIMQKLLRERGIDNNKQIIIYDGGEITDAARVFWALEVYGLQHVRILNGGFRGWTSKSYPVTDKKPDVVMSKYVPTINHLRIASKFATQLATNTPTKLVVDARSREAYNGEISTAKRFGHIPTATSIPVTSNITEVNGVPELLEQSELEKIYSGLPKDHKIILYCDIGKASSTNYLALRELGYDVANYDSSWREWGNDDTLPIEK